MRTSTRRRTRKSSPQPNPKPAAVGLTDQQRVERMPLFGPGLKIRISLNPLPAYMRANHLEALDPNPDPEMRRRQTDTKTGNALVYVKRVAPKETPQDPDLWRCLECADHPELVQPDMILHMQQVHGLDPKNAVGTKNLIMALDGAGYYSHTWEYNIDGKKFLRYHYREKSKG